MRPTLVLLAALALTSSVACHEAEPIGVPRPGIWTTAGTDTVPGNGSVMELRAMKQRWAAARDGRDYAFETAVSCFCPDEYVRAVIVEVSSDAVTRVRDAETGASRPADRYWTIEGLFDRAIAERAGGGRVRATYARASGYPVWIEIGTPENDAGAQYSVTSVMVE